MSDNYSHIDDLLNEHLGSEQIESSPTQRKAFMKKAALHRFWHFYPAAFNVYYLLLIVAFFAVMLLVSVNMLSNESAVYNPEESVREVPELPEPQPLALPLANQTLQEEINASNEDKPQGEERRTVSPASDRDPVSEKTKLLETASDDTPVQTEQDTMDAEIPIEPLPVVYDTVVQEKRVEVTDTVEKEVKQTIEVKEDGRKRRRR